MNQSSSDHLIDLDIIYLQSHPYQISFEKLNKIIDLFRTQSAKILVS